MVLPSKNGDFSTTLEMLLHLNCVTWAWEGDEWVVGGSVDSYCHVLSENIWLVWSKHNWEKLRCHVCDNHTGRKVEQYPQTWFLMVEREKMKSLQLTINICCDLICDLLDSFQALHLQQHHHSPAPPATPYLDLKFRLNAVSLLSSMASHGLVAPLLRSHMMIPSLGARHKRMQMTIQYSKKMVLLPPGAIAILPAHHTVMTNTKTKT